jgi:predicted dehydrogenase
VPNSNSSPLRVAVVGCGNVSRGHIRVRQLLREGIVGDIISIEAAHNHPSHLEHDGDHGEHETRRGGRLDSDSAGHYLPSSEMTRSTHVFDFMRYIGGEVHDVFAFEGRGGTFALLRFESGAMGKATAGSASDQGLATPHVLSVQGTKGTLFTQYNRVDSAWGGGYHGYTVVGGTQAPIAVAERDTGHGDRNRTRNFLDAVFDDAPLIAPLEDSVRTSELLHAIWQSHTLEIRVPVHRAHKTG